MGYYMSQIRASFKIKRENFAAALEAAKKTYAKCRWEYDKAQACDSLTAFLHQCGWCADISDDGDIDDILFEGEKASDDDELFSALAPFVEDGSFITMQGEDHEIWTWEFQDDLCTAFSVEIDPFNIAAHLDTWAHKEMFALVWNGNRWSYFGEKHHAQAGELPELFRRLAVEEENTQGDTDGQ